MISAEPARRVLALGALAASHDDFIALLETGSAPDIAAIRFVPSFQNSSVTTAPPECPICGENFPLYLWILRRSHTSCRPVNLR